MIRRIALVSFAVLASSALASCLQAQQPHPRVPIPAQVPDPVALDETTQGAKGWKVSVPGRRALATPAVVDGKVFLGGGFGSHEFYAFDAATGKVAWQYQTHDDGPTAAVVSDGYVIFNTESCELEVLAIDGTPVWKKWLGDPLMSIPAVADGKVFMCYPDSRGDHQHHLACFELKTGLELWKRPIAGEIITAPIIAEGNVFLACLEGTAYCFAQADGALQWQDKKNVTSSPIVWNKRCFFSRREEVAINEGARRALQQTEILACRGNLPHELINDWKATQRKADYLDFTKRQAASPVAAQEQLADAGVGFGGAKGSAKIAQAMGNLGRATVCGVWSYQGSKPFVYQGRLYASMGDTVQCIDAATEKVIWTVALHDKKEEKKEELLDAVLTPPSIVNGKLYVGTSYGDVICVSTDSGKELRRVKLGEPIVFQPAVVKGRVFVSTSQGTLYCFETEDVRDDGWAMWGGTAAHNGI